MKMWENKESKFYLPRFPFFETVIRVSDSSGKLSYQLDYCYHSRIIYEDLREAKKAIIEIILKQNKIDCFEDLPRWTSFRILSDGWPNNIGNGKYVNLYKHKVRYKWITGNFQFWRMPSNWYALRFNYKTNNEDLEKVCVKLFNRHLSRFKTQFSKK